MKQKSFFKTKDFPTEFGGELLKNKRKSMRPLSTKKPIHSVLRADVMAIEIFAKNRKLIISTINTYAQRFGVKVYEIGLARDHIHLGMRVNSRESYNHFVRSLTGVLSKALKIKWLLRPYTKVIQWGRHLQRVLKYILQNDLEGLGVIPYQARGRHRPRPG
jgi:REP element-mobilizing transposase RayT